MREFMRRAIQKSQSMNEVQLKNFVKLLIEEYSLLDAVMDSISDGVIVASPNNKIVTANRAAERILANPLTESQEKNVWEYIEEEQIGKFIAGAIQNESGEITEEFHLISADKPKYIEVSVLPLVKEKK